MPRSPDPELVVHNARQARRGAPVLFVGQVGIVVLLSRQVDHTALLVWLALAGVNDLRMFVANHLEIRRFERTGFDPWYLQRNVVHGALSAGIWGVLPVVAERYGTDASVMASLLFVLAFLTGVVYGTAGSRVNFLTAMLSCVMPMLAATAVGIVAPSLLTVLFVCFAGALTIVHHSVHELLMAHTQATAENRDLAGRLAEALATEDPVTGAKNRSGLDRWLHEHDDHDGDEHDGERYLVAVTQVERLAHLRWLLGHQTGDDLVAMFADRLRAELDDQSVLVRLSEQQFAIVSRDTDAPLSAHVAAATAELFEICGQRVAVTAATRTAVTCSVTDTIAELETALRRRHTTTPLDTAGQPTETQLEVLAAIPDAIGDGRIGAWFQPMVSIKTGAIAGWEALVRWEDPVHGRVSPTDLLPLASAGGHLPALTTRMLADSADFIVALNEAGHDGAATVHVNVDAGDLEPWLEQEIIRLLRLHRIPAARLVVEITERHLISVDLSVISLLESLRGRGVRIAIDDFGTGYSSLSHLVDLPVDCIKIDRRFVSAVDIDPSSRALVRSVIALADGLGYSTIAEGVESRAQADALAGLGCGHFQGFLTARAMRPGQAIDWLDRYRTTVDTAETLLQQ